jgi:hypothetical protein
MTTLERHVIKGFEHFKKMDIQERSYYCASGSFQPILRLYGIEASQDEIYKIGREAERGLKSLKGDGSQKRMEEGIGHQGLIAIGKHYLPHGFVKRNADIDILKFFIDKDIPVIVNWWQDVHDKSEDKDKGHYSVIAGYKMTVKKKMDEGRYSVFLADPFHQAPATNYWLDYGTFLNSWYDKSHSKIHRRWMAAFFKEQIKIPFSGIHVKQ